MQLLGFLAQFLQFWLLQEQIVHWKGCVLLAYTSKVYFLSQSEDTQQQIIRETFHLVSKRDENVCNFLEGGL